jgi:hypothetical protein
MGEQRAVKIQKHNWIFDMSKEKSKEYIVLQSIIGKKSVSFHPDFARALGSIPAGLFMSQGFFWQYKADYKDFVEMDGLQYFSKTAIEWEEVTALSDEQQKLARTTLVKAGILNEVRRGMPAKLYFHFDFDAIVNVLSNYLSTGLPVSGKHGNKIPGNTETLPRETRKQDSGKHGNNYIGREYIESLETTTESEKVAEAAEQFPEVGNMILAFEEEKKVEEKTPRARAASPAPADPALDQMEWLESLETDYRVPELLKQAHGVPPEKHLDYLAAFRASELQ